MELHFDPYYTMIGAVLVLLVGKFMVRRIAWLRDFNIPEPVAGGLVAATFSYLLYLVADYRLSFHGGLQNAAMLMFFSSIGLSASLAKLKAGGRALLVFLLVIVAFVAVQNAVGISMATLLGLDPLVGLIAGSISLLGGHGTAGAWGAVLEREHGVQGAMALGMACATFGLVMGGMTGGPLAKWLIRRHQLQGPELEGDEMVAPNSPTFAAPHKTRLITTNATIEALALFAGCLGFAQLMSQLMAGAAFQLPTFVWALGGGVIIRNVLDYVFRYRVFDRAIDVFGNTALSIYLAIALLSLKLWELAGLAGPLVVILAVQAVAMLLYVALVTFRVMGRDYDAAVLCAGHCGFALGATPTAVANMQAITNQYGPSYKAFLIVPMVGAFFIDLLNAVFIQLFIQWLG